MPPPHSPLGRYPPWVQRLASRDALLHPEPSCRLSLAQLLAAICGDAQGEARNEALLGLLVAKASGPSLLRVQRSLSRVDSSRSSASWGGSGGGGGAGGNGTGGGTGGGGGASLGGLTALDEAAEPEGAAPAAAAVGDGVQAEEGAGEAVRL